jgi:hypothetical protein
MIHETYVPLNGTCKQSEGSNSSVWLTVFLTSHFAL